MYIYVNIVMTYILIIPVEIFKHGEKETDLKFIEH